MPIKKLTFKGVELPEWVWITKEPLQLSAPVEWEYMKRKTGAVPTKRHIGSRPLPFSVSILANSEEDLHRKAEQLAGLLYSKKPEVLTRSSEPGREYMAVWERDTDFDKIFETGEGVLNFTVPAGLKQGPEQTGTAFVSAQTLTIGGNYETYPLFEVTFTAARSDYRIQHENGQYILITRDFLIGDILVIDHAKEFVTLNGSGIMPALRWQESRFFALQPGANGLSVTGNGASTVAKYREKWQ